MFRLFSFANRDTFEISDESLKLIAHKTNSAPIKGYVHEFNIPLWFRVRGEAELLLNFLKQNYSDKFDWTRVEVEEGKDHTFTLNIIGKNNMTQFQRIFYLAPDKTFTISQESLDAIADKAKVLPIRGYVHGWNIPLWFGTQNEAEQFLKFLKQNYSEKFDWSRVELEDQKDSTYVVNIISKENMREFRKVFDLQEAPEASYNKFYPFS